MNKQDFKTLVREGHIDFSGVRFEGSMVGAVFNGLDLDFADFTGLDLRYSRFVNCKVAFSTFAGGDLRHSKFENIDPEELDLQGAILSDNTTFKEVICY